MRNFIGTAAISFAAITNLALAVPSPADNALEQRSGKGGVFWCLNANWKGPCDYESLPLGSCKNFIGSSVNAISSIGPARGIQCRVFTAKNCSAGAGDAWMSWPGFSDLGSSHRVLNKNLESIWCRAEPSVPEVTAIVPIPVSTAAGGLLVAGGATPAPH
ncbi:hypothetical protein LTS18_007101 [Coniosporium uncinatum]|uniref:Uncharacterized protein n=1 Tax=Coniosporium uncinatum TaxID=93489 RepID=A0ACC3DPV3_9PEZI|nr:hypothetical protein LTS18_007101 [Coniosporium uncinatum]